jgi:hypothetical protein
LHLLFEVRGNTAPCAIAGAIALRLGWTATQLRWDASLNIDAQLMFVTSPAMENSPHALFLFHRYVPFILDGSSLLPIRTLPIGTDIYVEVHVPRRKRVDHAPDAIICVQLYITSVIVVPE